MRRHLMLKPPPHPSTVRAVRRALDEVLREAGFAQSVRDELAVAVTEACSNVIRHSGTTEPYRVLIDVNEDRCRIEILDCGRGFDPEAVPAMVRPDADGNRGLLIMRALVDHLHVEAVRPRGMKITMLKMA